jgi:NAD(P)-dependent dehydrogenase (short-subunit alcohol dehydrogenase family)
VRAFASDLQRDCGDCAVLCNNAGLMCASWSATEDGHETTWQVNALAPWLLATLLLPSLARAAAQSGTVSRLVNVGSRLEKTGDIRSNLESEPDLRKRFAAAAPGAFATFKQYGTSKAALTAATFEARAERERNERTEHAVATTVVCVCVPTDALAPLAAQLARRAPPGVSVSLCTPGMVNTDLSRFAPFWLRALSAPLRWALLRTPAAGAATPVWLCACEDAEAVRSHGGYFYNRERIAASDAASDAATAAAVWQTLEAQAASR